MSSQTTPEPSPPTTESATSDAEDGAAPNLSAASADASLMSPDDSPSSDATMDELPKASCDPSPQAALDEEPMSTCAEKPKPTLDEEPVATCAEKPKPTLDEEPMATCAEKPKPTLDEEPVATCAEKPKPALDEELKVTLDEATKVTVDEVPKTPVDEAPKTAVGEELKTPVDEEPKTTADEAPKTMVDGAPKVVVNEVFKVTVDEAPKTNVAEKPLSVSLGPAPIFQVAFRDDKAFQYYHQKVEKFLKTLIQNSNGDKRITSSTKDLLLEIFDSDSICKHSSRLKRSRVPSPQRDSVRESTRYHPQRHDSPKLDERQSSDFLFTVDTEPKLKGDLDIPMYGKRFNKAMEKSQEEIPENKDNCATPKMTCFNCLGNHSLRDCSQPRNFSEINKNRKSFNMRKGAASNSRYHLDDDQKFGHFVPGQISPNLRKALGLKDCDLPRHIYRMRVLGYPPGWLEEARLQHSGLALFNSDGVAEQGSDEEGEIVSPGDKDQYDIKKIIDFPGFNTLPSKGIKDEYMQYWGSVEQENHSKETMIAFLSFKKADDGYKRRKLPNPLNSQVKTDIIPSEMELDAVEECLHIENLFIPPLPKNEGSEPPPPPPPVPEDSESSQSQEDNSNSGSAEPSSRDGSPSLLDLEHAKKQLLAELDVPSTQPNVDLTKAGEPTPDPLEAVTNLDSSKTELSDLNSSRTIDSNSINVNNVTPKNSPKPMLGSGHKLSKAVLVGTPILHSCSPFKRLPSSEKFSKDICDVINFENLPDATGKYDQMTELLQKVRSTISELNKE